MNNEEMMAESIAEADVQKDGTEAAKDAAPAEDEKKPEAAAEGSEGRGTADYAELIRADLAALRSEFPELADMTDITELPDPMRYAALRDLGLDAAEAYLASSRRRGYDTRSHLSTAYGRASAPSGSAMTQRALAEAREIFSGLTDSEIQRLYRKVTR